MTERRKEAFSTFHVGHDRTHGGAGICGIQDRDQIPYHTRSLKVPSGQRTVPAFRISAGSHGGGLAAGFGSFLFDVVFWGGSPAGWIVTFVTKSSSWALWEDLCFKRHMFSRLGLVPELVLCGLFGEIAYIIGYLLKEFVTYRFIMGSPMSLYR